MLQASKNNIPGLIAEVFPRGFCKIALYKTLERFLQDILVILQSSGCNVTEKKCFKKTYRISF